MIQSFAFVDGERLQRVGCGRTRQTQAVVGERSTLPAAVERPVTDAQRSNTSAVFEREVSVAAVPFARTNANDSVQS